MAMLLQRCSLRLRQTDMVQECSTSKPIQHAHIKASSFLRHNLLQRHGNTNIALRMPAVRAKRNNGPNVRLESDGKGGYTVIVPESNITIPMWQLAFPFLALLGVGAMLGPLLFGSFIFAGFVASLGIGIAMSVSALALSTVFLPFILMSGIGMFFFGGLAFSAVSGVAVAGLGLAAGWAAVKLLLPKTMVSGNLGASSAPVETEEERAQREAEEEARRMRQQLREFDEVLDRRERDKRRIDRVDRW